MTHNKKVETFKKNDIVYRKNDYLKSKPLTVKGITTNTNGDILVNWSGVRRGRSMPSGTMLSTDLTKGAVSSRPVKKKPVSIVKKETSPSKSNNVIKVSRKQELKDKPLSQMNKWELLEEAKRVREEYNL